MGMGMGMGMGEGEGGGWILLIVGVPFVFFVFFLFFTYLKRCCLVWLSCLVVVVVVVVVVSFWPFFPSRWRRSEEFLLFAFSFFQITCCFVLWSLDFLCFLICLLRKEAKKKDLSMYDYMNEGSTEGIKRKPKRSTDRHGMKKEKKIFIISI